MSTAGLPKLFIHQFRIQPAFSHRNNALGLVTPPGQPTWTCLTCNVLNSRAEIRAHIFLSSLLKSVEVVCASPYLTVTALCPALQCLFSYLDSNPHEHKDHIGLVHFHILAQCPAHLLSSPYVLVDLD